MGGAELAKIVEKHCGPCLRRKGSHRRYQGKEKQFTFTYHDGAEVSGHNVRQVLIDHIGLTATDARKEVS